MSTESPLTAASTRSRSAARIAPSVNTCTLAATVVSDDQLTLVGLEVDDPRPGTERDGRVAIIQRVREPAVAARVRGPPADNEPPDARIDEVGIAQTIQVGHHDFHSRRPQQAQIGRGP